MTLGFDVDKPWKDLPKKDRDWILFTDETPTVPVYSGLSAAEVQRAVKMKLPPSYMGTLPVPNAMFCKHLQIPTVR
jgi:excinuclease ABC subunit A